MGARTRATIIVRLILFAEVTRKLAGGGGFILYNPKK